MRSFLTRLYVSRSINLACCLILASSTILSAGTLPAFANIETSFPTEEAKRPKIVFSPLEHALMYTMLAICVGSASIGLYDLFEESKEELLELAGLKKQLVTKNNQE